MAKITVRFCTLLRQMVETDCVYLEADDLEEAVKQLESELGSRLQQQVVALGIGQTSRLRLRDYCVLLLNGRSVDRQKLNRIKVTPGDIMHVFLSAAGG